MRKTNSFYVIVCACETVRKIEVLGIDNFFGGFIMKTLLESDVVVSLVEETATSKKSGKEFTYQCLIFDFGDGNGVVCYDKDLLNRFQSVAISKILKKGG